MLTLSLLRHAKSSWANPGQQDFDRPLNERGLEAAPRMGAFMADHGIAPDLVLCSPSVRTRQTLGLVLPHFSPATYCRLRGRLLSGFPRHASQTHPQTRGRRNACDDRGARSRPAPAGHGTPGSGDPEAIQALAQKFPTAALAVIVFDGRSWSKVKPGAGRLELFMSPKRLP